MNTTAPFRLTLDRFPYDAAKRQAEKYSLTVVSVCHADIPKGAPLIDGCGNYIKARTVYIGLPGTIEKNCAFARCHSTIHQSVEPGTAEALCAIAGHLLYFDTFHGSRQEYIDYHNSPYRLLPYQQDQLIESWHEHTTTAQHAIKCLPAELIAWLRSLGDCY